MNESFFEEIKENILKTFVEMSLDRGYQYGIYLVSHSHLTFHF